jgi:hypothetical protein
MDVSSVTLDEENTPERVLPMGENIFDDVTGEFTLTAKDFEEGRYHRRFGY